MKVISGVYQGVTTIQLDDLVRRNLNTSATSLADSYIQAAETAAYMTVTHPDYAILAARIAVSNLHKQTKKQFSAVIQDLYDYVNPKTKKRASMIAENTYQTIMKNADELNSAIVYDVTSTTNTLASRRSSAHIFSALTAKLPRDHST